MKKLFVMLLVFVMTGIGASPALATPGQHGNMNAGELDAVETADLQYIREEEKLARDVYFELFDKWNEEIFMNIARSEQRHMDQMLRMIKLYGIDDPVAGYPVGEFSTQEFTELYEWLVEWGRLSLEDALRVGVWVEELDIQDLRDAIANTDEPALTGSYTNLLAGAHMHLKAFVGHLRALGVEYQPQVLEPEDFDEMTGDSESMPAGKLSKDRGRRDWRKTRLDKDN